MKHLLISISIFVCITGCASPPVYMTDNFHGKQIVRCDNDAFCFHEKYSVVWDDSCRSCAYPHCCGKSKGYPVSYRSREYTCENDPYGYAVTLPQGGNLAMP